MSNEDNGQMVRNEFIFVKGEDGKPIQSNAEEPKFMEGICATLASSGEDKFREKYVIIDTSVSLKEESPTLVDTTYFL
jgi:hypothetical protein